jgi:UDP-GlcNAc3NAcA epimerase
MKLVTVVGARPQFIKAAVVTAAIRSHNQQCGKKIEQTIVHTGQHFDPEMSDIFFDELKLPTPKYHLGIHTLSHGAMVGRMIEEIEKVLIKEKPDRVLVYGDTNSTLAGAITAKKLGIKLAHVEAGLRSFNFKMPEEQNRILTDRISNLLFCPTQTAVDNLRKEGIPSYSNGRKTCFQRIIKVGDVMYDAFRFYSRQTEERSNILERLGLKNSDFALSTLHRAENTSDPARLKNILEALKEIAKQIKVILPLHPRTKKRISDLKLGTGGIKVILPISYLDMLMLEKHCNMVMTDSGGVQKEAYFFKKPCITVREETEWTELVDQGVNKLAGAHKKRILDSFKEFQSTALSFPDGLYGKGQTGDLIVRKLMD